MPVRRWDKIQIKASGRWKVFPKGKWRSPGDSSFYLRGKLDDEGKPFKVGADLTFVIPRHGNLFLGLNEGGRYDNNRGQIKLEIEFLD